MFARLIQLFRSATSKPEPFTAMPISAAGKWLWIETEVRREAEQYAQFPDALAGAIVGAPADPEAFG